MRVNVISNIKFLYKIKDILDLDKKILKKVTIYNFKNEYYLLLKKEISIYEIGYILEMTNLIYDGIVDDILKLGNKIKLK